jgi:hypothetical protein
MCGGSPSAVLFFVMPILALLASLFYCIPQTFEKFALWKKTEKPTWFSVSVFFGFASTVFVLFFYVVYFQVYLHYKLLVHSEILKLTILLITIWLSYAVFIPKTLLYFQHWHSRKKPMDFSRMIFFGLFSFYFLSMIFLELLISSVGLFNHGK